MTKTKAKQILIECFKALPKADRTRLEYHYEQKTRIVCGKDHLLYSDGIGGG